MVFGEMTDDQVLQILAKRKQLTELRVQYEQVQMEQARQREMETEKAHIEDELKRLNSLITSDKPDDELIHLIEERKSWEAKLEALTGVLAPKKNETSSDEPKNTDEGVAKNEKPVDITTEEAVSVVDASAAPALSIETEPVSEVSAGVDEGFGEHKIVDSTIDPASELGQALNRIQSDPDALGKVLDDLPTSAKRDKTFMLSVAEVDPAYAMHYADKDTLKKDEDFNLKVIATKGKRMTGSILAEMLPEARTATVVMSAIKQDYRNVRFALPQMTGYDDMLEKAKKAALDKVKELKDSVDITLLIPKVLQKDKTFMKKVEEIVPKEE